MRRTATPLAALLAFAAVLVARGGSNDSGTPGAGAAAGGGPNDFYESPRVDALCRRDASGRHGE